MNIPFIEENDQTSARKQHLAELQQLIGNVYPNKFDRSSIAGNEDTISNLLSFEAVTSLVPIVPEGEKPLPEVKEAANVQLKNFGNVRISGRLATPPRTMGKAAFVHLSDGVNRLQIYVRKQDVTAISNDTSKSIEDEGSGWQLMNLLDHGDFIGVEGYLFVTNTGELSVHVETIQFLAKALLPMPDKVHGIADPELQRRYRYADLIADSLKIEHEGQLTTREVFERRAKLISGMRNYLDAHGYIEVETPMLTPKATGAAAKPFATHHNALDIPLYARIAPELYLKRLVVGGFEKVYELNRNFRNEGIDSTHNPEFTMLEFYCAYMDVNGMMDFCEAMIKESVQKATGGSFQVKYGENDIDFSKFERLTMKGAIVKYFKEQIPDVSGEKISEEWLESDKNLLSLSKTFMEIDRSVIVPMPSFKSTRPFVAPELFKKTLEEKIQNETITVKPSDNDRGHLIEIFFERIVEENLIQPTFIIDYPKSISPLSKASPDNSEIAERFELFINGMECANGFSELNDPAEQYERFLDQAKARESGDDEAMVLDEDYIRALSYGMPPAAGIGIGIDRLVMLLTNRHSIRDVILFPHLRPEKKDE